MLEAINLVKLGPLMDMTNGIRQTAIGLIDGPVATGHVELETASLRRLRGTQESGLACQHGTFVAGILSAKRGSSSPAICPNCTLLIRPIFGENAGNPDPLSASAADLARAVTDCVEAGARVLNISASIGGVSRKAEAQAMERALDLAFRRQVLVVAAAGNQSEVGSTVITGHPWTIPVGACDLQGRPMAYSNVSRAIGTGGLRAPGERITSLGADSGQQTSSGSSAAAPFVTGTIALLWSLFPAAAAARIKLAVTRPFGIRGRSVMPPLLDAWAAYSFLAASS